jgi:WD40 repeat protein
VVPNAPRIRGDEFWPRAITEKGLASGSTDGTVRLSDVPTSKQKATLPGHKDVVRSVAFAPDGMTAATAGQDGTIVIWDVDLP